MLNVTITFIPIPNITLSGSLPCSSIFKPWPVCLDTIANFSDNVTGWSPTVLYGAQINNCCALLRQCLRAISEFHWRWTACHGVTRTVSFHGVKKKSISGHRESVIISERSCCRWCAWQLPYQTWRRTSSHPLSMTRTYCVRRTTVLNCLYNKRPRSSSPSSFRGSVLCSKPKCLHYIWDSCHNVYCVLFMQSQFSCQLLFVLGISTRT